MQDQVTKFSSRELKAVCIEAMRLRHEALATVANRHLERHTWLIHV